MKTLSHSMKLLFLVSVAHAHLGPDEGIHHFLDQLFAFCPYIVAACGVAWAKLRR